MSIGLGEQNMIPLGQQNMTADCESYAMMRSGEGRPTHFSFVLLLPITLVTLLTLFFHFLLKPIGIGTNINFVAQMLAGIPLGPSFLGYFNQDFYSRMLFPQRAKLALNMIEALGFVFMFFTVSARTDKGIFKRFGRQGIVIGLGSIIFPFFSTLFVSWLAKDAFKLDGKVRNSLSGVAVLESTTAFPVILNLLTDLKLLNSELGRLAISSSLISSVLSWFLPSVVSFLNIQSPRIQNKHTNATLLMNLSVVFMILIIFLVLRPMIFWMIRQTPEGKSLKPGHVLAINLMVLGVALYGEFNGQQGLFAPFILGLIIPVRPPMGPLLTDKIHYFVWSVIIPCFVINTGRRIDLLSINFNSILAVGLLALVSILTKSFAIIIPSIYYRIPFTDTLLLCLILNCRGIYDIQIFTHSKQRQVVSDESFGIMVMITILQSAIFIPLVKALVCDSSRRYVAYTKHTIQHSGSQDELRILACIHEQEYVPTIINILQVSNPPKSPLGVYVMNLQECVGDSIPVVVSHKLGVITPSSSKHNKVDPMINALHTYQQQNVGFTTVQCYTAIAPYASMHDDICSMAFQKYVSLVIIPFQKTDGPGVKSMIKNVLKMAPCSVAVLFERGIFMEYKPIFSRRLSINVCALFLEGADDRETLAYALRMAQQDNDISLRVIRFIATTTPSNRVLIEENVQDLEMINEFKASNMDKKNVEYVEENVTEGCDTAKVLHSIADEFDLILVGRRHDNHSQILLGLAEWSEIEELGVIGDLLVSSDFKSRASIMVIQQHKLVN